jgi:REP element-mobilizing transposase RayT
VRRSEQLPLRFERKWGGARKGAGRPNGARNVPHRARPVHKERYPLHVTVRARGGLPSFRDPVLAKVVVGTISRSHRDVFRVLHYSVQDNHVHLVVEADDATCLARGMQRLNSRIARNVNDALGIHGQIWRERYHARALRYPRSVRNAIVYVLMNAKKHGYRFASGIDALSSACFFDGLVGVVVTSEASPVRAPRTWLAGVGWRRRGLIRTHEQPRTPD